MSFQESNDQTTSVKALKQGRVLGFNPITSTSPCYNNVTTCTWQKNTKYTHYKWIYTQ